MRCSQHTSGIPPRKDHRGVDWSALVWRTNAVSNAIGYAQHYSRSYHAVDFARMIMLAT